MISSSAIFVLFLSMHRTTIYAARLVDDLNNPALLRFGTPYPGPVRVEQGPMRTAASADLKHSAAGLRSSWEAAHYYMDQTIQRRDELLAKYAKERESSSGATDAPNDVTPTNP